MKSNLIPTIGIIIFSFIGSALAAPPKLTLVKAVVGGEATETDWVLTADGTDANDLSGAGFISGFVDPDTFLLSESAGQPGYTAGDWDCTGGGILDGQSLTLSEDEVVTCTIINTYEPPVVVFDTDFALPSLPIGDGAGTPVCVDEISGLLMAGCDAAFNTNLTEAEVDAYVSDNGYSTGSHTVDTDTHLSEADVDSFVADNGYSTGPHTVDTDTTLSEGEVDAFVANNDYSTGAHTVHGGTFSYSITTLTCIAQSGAISGDLSACIGGGTSRTDGTSVFPCSARGTASLVTYVCDLELPSGSLIDEIIAYGHDASSTGYMEASVYRTSVSSFAISYISPTYAGTFQTTGIVATPGSTNFPIYLSSDPAHTVDGSYKYNIMMGLHAPTGTVRGYGFKVTYTIP